MIGLPSSSAAAASSGAVCSRESIPGHARSRTSSIEAPAISLGIDASTASSAARLSARRSQISSPAPGTTLIASPLRMNCRHGRQPLGAVRIAQRRDNLRRLGQREQRAHPLLGGAAAVGGTTVGDQLQRAGRLAAHDDGIVAIGAALTGFEAEAGVEAGEARAVSELAAAPLLVGDQQQCSFAELWPPLKRAQRAECQRDASLHVGRAGPDQVVAAALRRQERVMRDDRVEVAYQQDLELARPVDRDQQVGRVLSRRAGQPLDP